MHLLSDLYQWAKVPDLTELMFQWRETENKQTNKGMCHIMSNDDKSQESK